MTIALLSAAALGYEILLIRLFSIIQWHHFAYMIISLALLGYGASGTFLSFTQQRLLQRYPLTMVLNLALFALSILPCFLLAQHIQFNPEEMLWNWREALRLVMIYLLLALPFFFAANSIAITLSRYRSVITRIYAADLLGAGIGSLAVLLLLYAVPPLMGLSILSTVAVACLVVAAVELRLPGRNRITAAAILLMALSIWLGSALQLELSPYKALSQELRVDGARIVNQRYSPLGLLHVVENPVIPRRYAPGMSLNAAAGPPRQLSLYSDGNSLGAITRDSGEPQSLQFLDQLTSALPYHLQHPDSVLVPGAGGGMSVLQARYQQVREVDAVELNPQIAELLSDDYAAFTNNLYRRPGVHVHIDEARGFISNRNTRYALIQLSLQGAGDAASSGLYALSEDYLYTTEAFKAYLRLLQSGGYIAITQLIKLPPRDTLKLLATAIDALQASGTEQPGRQLMLIRGWQTSTLLIKNGIFTTDEIHAMQLFCRSRAFDVAWYPGMSAAEANRYNLLREPYFYQAAQALLGPDRQLFLDSYKFNLNPATDDQPFFHNFFKWSTLMEILRLRGQGGLPLLETGYPVIIATLAQAVLLSLALVLLPLLLIKKQDASETPHALLRLRIVAYFAAIGVAFLFLEIAFIQKFMRFLHQPVFTAAVVLASFLIFAGLGSSWSRRYSLRGMQRSGMRHAATGIVLTGLVYLFLLDPLFNWLSAWPAAARMVVSSLLIAPLAFFMGSPFPLALSSLGKQASSLIPLAWGVNGCASVLSAVLATLLAIHFGFLVVIVLALMLYAVSAFVFPATDY
ncbi:MAG: SAM-dependent methyltransferase [Gammaproteobacteria bacterium]|nr:SAM-dependent methyltransferase [Gammaproteobacteria bacterium]